MSRFSIEQIRAYQEIHYGRTGALLLFSAVFVAGTGLALPDLLEFVPVTTYRVLQAVQLAQRALPYVERGFYGFAVMLSLRGVFKLIQSRSWWFTRRLARRLG